MDRHAITLVRIAVAVLLEIHGAYRLASGGVAPFGDWLASLGLPLTYRPDRWTALLAAMRRDKKTRGDLLRFVVLADLGRPVRLEGPPEELLQAAYAAISD